MKVATSVAKIVSIAFQTSGAAERRYVVCSIQAGERESAVSVCPAERVFTIASGT